MRGAIAAAGVAWLLSVGLCGALAQAEASEGLAGTWKGTWEGGGAGGALELTFETADEGALSGGVSVKQDLGDYVSRFESIEVEGAEFRGRYPYTPDEQADIILTGKVEEDGLSGTWAMVEQGSDDTGLAIASGTWKVSRP